MKKERENKYVQNEDRLGRDLFVIKKSVLNNFSWEFYYNKKGEVEGMGKRENRSTF